MNQQVFEKVSAIIADVLGRPDLKIQPETSAADVEEWDSFNHINITVAIESAFGIKFKAAEIEELGNVGELVGLVEKKMATKKKS